MLPKYVCIANSCTCVAHILLSSRDVHFHTLILKCVLRLYLNSGKVCVLLIIVLCICVSLYLCISFYLYLCLPICLSASFSISDSLCLSHCLTFPQNIPIKVVFFILCLLKFFSASTQNHWISSKNNFPFLQKSKVHNSFVISHLSLQPFPGWQMCIERKNLSLLKIACSFLPTSYKSPRKPHWHQSCSVFQDSERYPGPTLSHGELIIVSPQTCHSKILVMPTTCLSIWVKNFAALVSGKQILPAPACHYIILRSFGAYSLPT